MKSLGSTTDSKRLSSIQGDRIWENGECPRQVCVILNVVLHMIWHLVAVVKNIKMAMQAFKIPKMSNS